MIKVNLAIGRHTPCSNALQKLVQYIVRNVLNYSPGSKNGWTVIASQAARYLVEFEYT